MAATPVLLACVTHVCHPRVSLTGVTCHPPHPRSWVTQSIRELEVHSRMFDEMGFLPPTPHNKVRV